MKKIATIEGENGETITISFEEYSNILYTESFGEPTMQVGPQFRNEEQAAEYIQDSWGRDWNLTWIEEASHA